MISDERLHELAHDRRICISSEQREIAKQLLEWRQGFYYPSAYLVGHNKVFYGFMEAGEYCIKSGDNMTPLFKKPTIPS